MTTHQFQDFSQVSHCMEDYPYAIWSNGNGNGNGNSNNMLGYKQYTVHFDQSEAIYIDNLDDGRVSMQPMQRFMVEQSPLTPGLLHANIPLQTQFERQYNQQWSSMYHHRYASPDQASTFDNSSYATQNEVCSSPHLYQVDSWGSPENISLSYPATEHFFEEVPLLGTPLPNSSISLRELEYEHIEPELIFENVDSAVVKQDVAYVHEHCSVNMDATPDSNVEYADSGIGSSVRDAEEVQLIGLGEDSSSDSDYSPSSTRPSKRRRSSTLGGSTGRGQKRRVQGAKDSAASRSSRCNRKPRKAPNVTKANTGAHGRTTERRSFPCTLAMYGCTSTFSSKNEWGRHLRTQHIKLGYWRCNHCPPTTDPNDPDALYFNDFNRKDLFTQHLRRMHAAPADSSRNAKDFPVTEENLHEHQARCYLQLRSAPQQSGCLFCDRVFAGPVSWEERVEHVGRHFEKDWKSRDTTDVTAWNKDEELERYLCEEGLIVREQGQWKIGDGKPRRRSSDDSSMEESEEE